MVDHRLTSGDFQTRLLVWAARIVRTAAEVESDPEQIIKLVDMARRLEDMARSKLLDSFNAGDVSIEPEPDVPNDTGLR